MPINLGDFDELDKQPEPPKKSIMTAHGVYDEDEYRRRLMERFAQPPPKLLTDEQFNRIIEKQRRN